jgi:hypothetical protein
LRAAADVVPIAEAKKKGAKQLQFDTEWTQDRIEENKLINDIRRLAPRPWRLRVSFRRATTPHIGSLLIHLEILSYDAINT